MATMRASGLGKRQNGAKPSAFELGARRTVQPHVFPSVKTHGAAQMDIHPKDVECHAIRTCVTGQYLLDRAPSSTSPNPHPNPRSKGPDN